ncbi:MAG: hypothetical protein K2J62_07910 [Bacteroidales bacterium]|nr:hypothetical protein [Bacteroidales bacterium]
MKKSEFDNYIALHINRIGEIRNDAQELHRSVGQTYGKELPYSHHLSMVADAAMEYGHEVIHDEHDIMPVIFAAYFHDSIEDARLTYNDVTKAARQYMDEGQAFIAAEIVYALTNDKGRTRQERAGEHYYAGIRSTPFAPFVKLCDRFANMTFSSDTAESGDSRMRKVYQQEWPHFIESISQRDEEPQDMRFSLPENMLCRIMEML